MQVLFLTDRLEKKHPSHPSEGAVLYDLKFLFLSPFFASCLFCLVELLGLFHHLLFEPPEENKIRISALFHTFNQTFIFLGDFISSGRQNWTVQREPIRICSVAVTLCNQQKQKKKLDHCQFNAASNGLFWQGYAYMENSIKLAFGKHPECLYDLNLR